MVTVVAVEFVERTGREALPERTLARDVEPLHAVAVGHHVRFAGQRKRAAIQAQVFAKRHFADRERHAVPVGAVTAHRAAGVIRHTRRTAHAGTDEGIVEPHAARGQRVDMTGLKVGMSVAAEVIAAKLVAHDEENVAGVRHL